MLILEDLKVVDTSLALDLMGGYEQIYQKVIESFLENQTNLIEEVEENLINNMDEARRLVHSCKGISKNIGSLPLYQISSLLEQAIMTRDSLLIDAYFKDFKTIFLQVLSDLKKIQFPDN